MKKLSSQLNIDTKDMSNIQRLRMAIDQEAYEFIKRTEGMMLTVVDASFSDREQREAVKSLVRQNLWSIGFDASGIAIQFSEKFQGQAIAKDQRIGYISDNYPVRNHFKE